MASTHSGQGPATTSLPRGVAIRDVGDAMNHVSTQRTSGLGATTAGIPRGRRPLP